MKYKLNINFKNWKVGSILDKYEFKRLPQELKRYAIPINSGVGSIVQSVIRSKKRK
jgi:hypothetical protein